MEVFLIENYIKTTSRLLDEHKNDLNAKDYNAIKIKVHSIKSSSQQIGAMELGEMSKKIELDIINNQVTNIESQMNDLVSKYKLVEAELKGLIGSGS